MLDVLKEVGAVCLGKLLEAEDWRPTTRRSSDLSRVVGRTSYTSFQSNKEKFVYKDEISGREITCGLILFKMALDVMKPQLVIDHRAKERDLESLTLENCSNNVAPS